MLRLTELKLRFDQTTEALPALIAERLGVDVSMIVAWSVFKRSIDARKAELRAVYIVDVEFADALQSTLLARFIDDPQVFATPDMRYQLVASAPAKLALRPVVVGFGPCGIFAALLLAQMGFRPIVLERGKKVRERTQDTWALWRRRELNPESNVQFGEGGAGTFSDGKLYTQIRDPRFLGRKVMKEFVAAGANPDILIDAHPHIGTFKLVKVVENLRQQIIALGGEIRFQQRVSDILIDGDAPSRRVRGLVVFDLSSGQSYEQTAHHIVLALGHSSRDTFAMLHERGVAMSAKPFSIGLRIEHPQSLIDQARWGRHAGHAKLGSAEYKLVHHASNGRSVYSFCMCPGGTVVAATSEPGCVVTNGMSQYSRSERNANAGIVVGIAAQDFPREPAVLLAGLGDGVSLQVNADSAVHPLAGVVLQRQLESAAYLVGGSDYNAPGQLVGDFIAGKHSTQLGGVEPSYKPGVTLGDLTAVLPVYAVASIREALPAFASKIKGFDMPDAVLTGVETRTSSPLKIPRGENLQSINTRGLYPAGEGAGYAGGILSAGVDGIKVAEAIAKDLLA